MKYILLFLFSTYLLFGQCPLPSTDCEYTYPCGNSTQIQTFPTTGGSAVNVVCIPACATVTLDITITGNGQFTIINCGTLIITNSSLTLVGGQSIYNYGTFQSTGSLNMTGSTNFVANEGSTNIFNNVSVGGNNTITVDDNVTFSVGGIFTNSGSADFDSNSSICVLINMSNADDFDGVPTGNNLPPSVKFCGCELISRNVAPFNYNFDNNNDGIINYADTLVCPPCSWVIQSSSTCDVIPLPVQLLSLHGKTLINANLIEWISLSETNNKNYELYHSYNNIDYTFIYSIDGYNQNYNYYNYYDYNLNNKNFYKLLQKDFNGNTIILGIIELNRNDNNTIEIIDNKINITNIEKNTNIQIINMLGQYIYNSNTSNNISIELLSGIYILNIDGIITKIQIK